MSDRTWSQTLISKGYCHTNCHHVRNCNPQYFTQVHIIFVDSVFSAINYKKVISKLNPKACFGCKKPLEQTTMCSATQLGDPDNLLLVAWAGT